MQHHTSNTTMFQLEGKTPKWKKRTEQGGGIATVPLKRKGIRVKLLSLAFCLMVTTLLFFTSMSSTVYASEGICPSGPLGGTDINQAILPPPGLYASAIFGAITLPKWHDNHRQKVDSNGSVFVAGIGMMYAYEIPIFGGQVASTLFFGYQDQTFGPEGTPKNEAESSPIDTYSDLFIWSKFTPSQEFSSERPIPYGTGVLFGLGMTFPTGHFARSDSLNIGSNFYTVSPSVGITYTAPSFFGVFFGEATQISSRVFYNYYTENDDTDYTSGSTFSIDFSLTEINGPWQYGIAGFAFTQIENDEINGTEGGTRAGALNVGPIVGYNFMVGDRMLSSKLKLMATLEGKNITQSYGATFSIGTSF